jgi:hypothetical protein
MMDFLAQSFFLIILILIVCAVAGVILLIVKVVKPKQADVIESNDHTKAVAENDQV